MTGWWRLVWRLQPDTTEDREEARLVLAAPGTEWYGVMVLGQCLDTDPGDPVVRPGRGCWLPGAWPGYSGAAGSAPASPAAPGAGWCWPGTRHGDRGGGDKIVLVDKCLDHVKEF